MKIFDTFSYFSTFCKWWQSCSDYSSSNGFIL